MALGVDLQAISGLVERAFVFDAGKSIKHLAVIWCRISHTVAGEKWEPEFSCQVNRGVVSVFLLWTEMPLQFGIDISSAENRCEPVQQTSGFIFASGLQCL